MRAVETAPATRRAARSTLARATALLAHRVFEAQAAHTPDAIAEQFEGQKVLCSIEAGSATL